MAPLSIVFDDIFVQNITENHTAVSGFSGTVSRATQVKGDLHARVYTLNGYITLLDENSALMPFTNDPETNLWLLPMFPPQSRDNSIYPLPGNPSAHMVAPLIKNVHYFESFAPAASFVTLRVYNNSGI